MPGFLSEVHVLLIRLYVNDCEICCARTVRSDAGPINAGVESQNTEQASTI
jgi:hypothetical protein